MKALLVKYKLVIKFMFTFLLVYAILSFSYKLYLEYGASEIYYPDYITNLVAKQSNGIINMLGYKAEIFNHPNEASLKVFINNVYIARVVEGCNAISVIILFVSFVIAFASKFKITFLYILVGSVMIYLVNLFRIAIISIGFYHYPEYNNVLHNIIFPAIIYGLVVLLWLFWINKFSKNSKSNA